MNDKMKIQQGDITLQAYTYGDRSKPPLVLVHGYPDNHSVWETVAEQLAERYFVISYDVRGTGASQAPKTVKDYRLVHLSADLRAVVDTLIPGQPFHLAGHDWGAVQSWESVTEGPLVSRILSFTSISGPCLDHLGVWMKQQLQGKTTAAKAGFLKQGLRSWYIGFFHIPLLPTSLWKAGLDKLWPKYLQQREGISRPPHNPTQRRDGINGIKLYRANISDRLFKPQRRIAQCPVQVIVPTRDNYVGEVMVEDVEQWVPALYRRDIDASHWVTLSHPDTIAEWLHQFIDAVNRGKLDTMVTAQQLQQVIGHATPSPTLH